MCSQSRHGSFVHCDTVWSFMCRGAKVPRVSVDPRVSWDVLENL